MRVMASFIMDFITCPKLSRVNFFGSLELSTKCREAQTQKTGPWHSGRYQLVRHKDLRGRINCQIASMKPSARRVLHETSKPVLKRGHCHGDTTPLKRQILAEFLRQLSKNQNKSNSASVSSR